MTFAETAAVHPAPQIKTVPLILQKQGNFFEVWFFKINDPSQNGALWLRFTVLVTANGFRRIAEVWAVHFERDATTREVTRVFARQTHDIQVLKPNDAGGLEIGSCEWGEGYTRGNLQNKGNSIQWDLRYEEEQKGSFQAVPSYLRKTGLIQNLVETPGEDLRFTGTVIINGKTKKLDTVPGMRGYNSGSKNGHSWIWAHCNSFVDEQGNEAPFVFEGLSARAVLLGRFTSPEISSFYFKYRGQEYAFNTVWTALISRSKHTLTDWEFKAERHEISFRGKAKAELKDFAGLTYEDTDGSLLYCANSPLSDLQIHVYRRGKIESAFFARGTAAFEVATRSKNPYVAPLI